MFYLHKGFTFYSTVRKIRPCVFLSTGIRTYTYYTHYIPSLTQSLHLIIIFSNAIHVFMITTILVCFATFRPVDKSIICKLAIVKIKIILLLVNVPPPPRGHYTLGKTIEYFFVIAFKNHFLMHYFSRQKSSSDSICHPHLFLHLAQ